MKNYVLSLAVALTVAVPHAAQAQAITPPPVPTNIEVTAPHALESVQAGWSRHLPHACSHGRRAVRGRGTRGADAEAKEQGMTMQLANIPFETTDWTELKGSEHRGERGTAIWRTLNCGDVRIRIVEYAPGYLADHWCAKGHVVYCLEGELLTELQDGRTFVLRPGMSYQVGDGETPHRSSTAVGARLFIVD